jgi:hypothetical protein
METNIEFSKLQRVAGEGMKNKEDIVDMTTFEDIIKELGRARLHIEEHIEGDMSEKKLALLEKIRNFSADASENFRSTFIGLLLDKKGQISKRMADHINAKSLDLPSFTIAEGSRAQEILRDFGFEEEIDKKEFLVSFQLPKPLAHFWWKGGEEGEDSKVKNVGYDIIEWRKFYEKLMPVIWSSQAEYENEEGLDFNRINDFGEHDPKKYYYIWRVGKWPSEGQL